jgi:hypothetical protein
MDFILYQIWLWLSKRWFAYRITGMNKESYQTEVILFGSADVDIEEIARGLSDQQKEMRCEEDQK